MVAVFIIVDSIFVYMKIATMIPCGRDAQKELVIRTKIRFLLANQMQT